MRGTATTVRAPRLELEGAEKARVEALVSAAVKTRPDLGAVRAVALQDAEPFNERIAVVQKYGVVAGDPGLAGDRGDDGVVVADFRGGFDAAVEQAADDRLVDEVVADLEVTARRQLRDAGRGAVPQGERSMAFSP